MQGPTNVLRMLPLLLLLQGAHKSCALESCLPGPVRAFLLYWWEMWTCAIVLDVVYVARARKVVRSSTSCVA